MQKLFALTTALICALCLSACDLWERPVPAFEKSGELVVITVNGADTFYEDAQGNYTGLEFDLASEFARSLNLQARFVVVAHPDDVLPALIKHRGHLAAAGLTVQPALQGQVRFGPGYQQVQAHVVYNTDTPRPDNLKALDGKTVRVVAGKGHNEMLTAAREKNPWLKWDVARISSEDLLIETMEGKIDYAVADSTHVNLAKNLYPNLDTAFNLGLETSRAWAFPPDADAALLKKTREFFQQIKQNGKLQQLLDRYYGHLKRLAAADVSGILEKSRSHLPKLRKHFQKGAEVTGIDWRLLAALGYQESHWEALATSPTNVRGVMMLTEDTADRMKVTDRLDPAQSILAGSRYLLLLKESLPPRITEPDRTWMALAAYNIGMGHLEDARVLAQRLGLNANSWVDMKKALPLLARSEYFADLKHGYARGGEAVILAESIRTYYDILVKFEAPYPDADTKPSWLFWGGKL